MSFFSWFKKNNNATAISFDHDKIRYVAVEKTKQGITIADYGTIVCDEEIFDQRGGFNNAQHVIEKIQEAQLVQKTFHALREINVVIPDQFAVLFHTHVTKEDPKQMNDVIIDHIKTYLQAHKLLNYSEYVCEYDIIQETDFGYDLYVTLVPKSFIDKVIGLFKKVNIKVRHIETAHHSIASACLDIPVGSGYMSIALGQYATTIAMVHQDHLVSQERVSVGREHVLKTIEYYLGVDRENADKILNKHGLLGTHPDTGLLGELHLALAPIWRSIDRQIIEHAEKPYKMFGHRFAVTHSILYGEGVSLKGAPAFLEEKTGIPCMVLDVWQGRHHDRVPVIHMPAHETCVYAESLSLALIALDGGK